MASITEKNIIFDKLKEWKELHEKSTKYLRGSEIRLYEFERFVSLSKTQVITLFLCLVKRDNRIFLNRLYDVLYRSKDHRTNETTLHNFYLLKSIDISHTLNTMIRQIELNYL